MQFSLLLYIHVYIYICDPLCENQAYAPLA